VALQFGDLDGRVLDIVRAVSAGVLTTPKSGQGRRLTLGSHTAELWNHLAESWSTRWHDDRRALGAAAVTDQGATSETMGPWVFARDPAHCHRLGAEVLGRRFNRIRDDAGVPTATLHRLRHSVATTLVRDGKVLDAQARLGHADAATTLREYSHVIPGTDNHIADQIDSYLDRCRTTRSED
jgi:integrase